MLADDVTQRNARSRGFGEAVEGVHVSRLLTSAQMHGPAYSGGADSLTASGTL